MKRLISFALLLSLLFSMGGCMLVGPEFTVSDDILSVENTLLTPRMTLVGNEEKEIKGDEFWAKLVEAIDGKAIEDSPVLTDELCDCELTYTVRVRGAYPKGYYLTFHDHGIEISGYCKFRKCMDLLGIVEVDEETMSELIEILKETGV